MLFGNGLSALLTLMGISVLLVLLFIVSPLIFSARPASGWGRWLIYFGALGAGFMLLEVALLQRFVLLLGHPVYSLTVTLFSLLLGTGLGSFLSRRIPADRVRPVAIRMLVAVAAVALVERVCAATHHRRRDRLAARRAGVGRGRAACAYGRPARNSLACGHAPRRRFDGQRSFRGAGA